VTRQTVAKLVLERGGLLALLAFAVYVWLATPYIVAGDNAEFATIGAVGGVPHPSGYPLYALWLRFWSWLPATSPAHAASIATAFLGVMQVIVLRAACRSWGASDPAATIAVAIYAGAPIVLRLHTEAEVFALNGLIAAAVLWFSAQEGPLRGNHRAIALGLAAGLGMANHLTCVLVAPVGLLGIIRAVRESAHPKYVPVLVAISGWCVGMTAYLYLVLTAQRGLSWGHIDGIEDVLGHFLRRDYGGPDQFSPRQGEAPVVANIVALMKTVGRTWWWLPAIAAVTATGVLSARRSRFDTRIGWAALATSFAIAGPILAMRFNIKPEGLGLYVCRRFHVLPALLLAPAVAVSVDVAGTRLRRITSLARLRSRTVAFVAPLIFVATLASSLPYVAAVHSPAMQRGLENLLTGLPTNAVVVGTSDEHHFGLAYLQEALGRRRDVIVIAWGQVKLPGYRERLAAQTGISIVESGNQPASVALAQQVLASGRPLFIDKYLGNIARAFATYPQGVVFRVVPKGTAPPSAEEVFKLNRDLYSRFQLDYPTPGPNEEYATAWHERYAEIWNIIGVALIAEGKRDLAAVAAQYVEALEPAL
jgi:hypothetical protein